MKFKTLALAAALAATASAASAQEAPTIPLTLDATGPNTFATTFQRSVTGFFIDTFSFTPSSIAGTVSVSFAPVRGPVNFFAALLNNDGFSFYPESGATTFSFQSLVDKTQPLSLTLSGYGGDVSTLTDAAASYSGSISVQTVAAVPEPETYALLLAGLAVIGAMKRRTLRHRGPGRVVSSS